MADLSLIKPGSCILASDGALIGIVDAVEGGERIRMHTQDGRASGPDFIPASWVADVGVDVVHLNRDEKHARETMNDEIPAGDETS